MMSIPETMRLGTLLDPLTAPEVNSLRSDSSVQALRSRVEILGITPDHRQVGPGMIYVMPSADRLQDPDAIQMALERGAAAVICAPDAVRTAPDRCIGVADLRRALGVLATTWHGNPSRQLQVVGIRGEPRKRAAVAHYLGQLLSASKVRRDGEAVWNLSGSTLSRRTESGVSRRSSLAGCIGIEAVACLGMETCRGGGRLWPVGLEAMDALDVQRLLAAHARSGGDWAIVEWDERVADAGTLEGVHVGLWLDADSPGLAFDVQQVNRSKSQVAFHWENRSRSAIVPALGSGQLQSLGVALLGYHDLQMPESQLGLALTRLTSPEGWLESVEAGQPFSVWIDGAREAQSARETLETARAQVSGHLWVVVGGRADQDAKARHALGRAVAKFADVTMLTSDNPGRQSQTALMEEVGRAIPSDCQVWIEERSGAIRWVIRRMRSTDGLVVLGKGRRSRQDLGDVVLPFDDATHVRAALAERGHVGGF